MEINLPVIIARGGGGGGGGGGSIAGSRGRGAVAGGRGGSVATGWRGSVTVRGRRWWVWRSVRMEVSFPLVESLLLSHQVGTPHLLHGTPGLWDYNVSENVITAGDTRFY